MCGIAGLTNPGPEGLEALSASLGHRGPDACGTWSGPGIGLVHTRLAIIDLSPGGAQPMASPCGRWVITFNGEIFNYREVRGDLEARGEIFASNSDTEVLLRLVMRDGIGGLDKLAGMFAFAIWDREMQELLLVRDRFGIKPLVWAPLPHGHIAFASEIATLRRVPGVDLGLDRQALSEYLACLYVPHPRTIHAGIRKLAPGHWLKWRGGAIETGCWWQPAFTGGRSPTMDEAVEELMPLLRRAVSEAMVADLEVSCFLSGGVDSSLIAALMTEETRRLGAPAPRSFTMTFTEPAYDERDAAREVAGYLQTRHAELPARPQMAERLPEILRRFGEPFGNPTALLIHDLSGLAREHVKVALVGDGGDEVFAGYPRYAGGLAARHYRKAVPGFLRSGLIPRLASLIPESSSGWHTPRRIREFLSSAGEPEDAMYASWVEYFTPLERQALLGDSLPIRPVGALYRDTHADNTLDAMQQTDLESFLPGNLLAYGDAMSMDHALELRLPLLDHRLTEWIARIDPALRMAGGKKALLRAAAKRVLPAALVDRPKRGFNPPIGLWLRNELAGLLRDSMPDANLARLQIEPGPVRALLDEFARGRRDVGLKVWALLMAVLWAEDGLSRA